MALHIEREKVELTVCDFAQPAVVEIDGELQEVAGIRIPELNKWDLPNNCPRLIGFDPTDELGCYACKEVVYEERKLES